MLSDWGEDHPFFMRAAGDKNGLATVIDKDYIFRDNVNFERSEDFVELQLADLVAGIIGKVFNDNTFLSVYNKLKKYIIPPQRPILMLKMATPEKQPQIRHQILGSETFTNFSLH